MTQFKIGDKCFVVYKGTKCVCIADTKETFLKLMEEKEVLLECFVGIAGDFVFSDYTHNFRGYYTTYNLDLYEIEQEMTGKFVC